MTERFEFYGLTIEVNCKNGDLINEIVRDFSYFRLPEAQGIPGVQIDIHSESPCYEGLPAVPASFLTPRNVCYKDGETSYIDYFGRGLAIYNRKDKRCTMYAEEHHLAREMVYLFILSTIGEHLDRQRLHRIHALGVNYQNRAILLLLPSGGGKSTMALKLLNQPGFSLLSEDTPLIDRRGKVHPFPLCLGVRPENHPDIPSKYLRTVQRMEFDPKILIDIEYFNNRLSEAVAPGVILIGQRHLGDRSAIVPIARHRALRSLVKYMVVGLGVYQGLEFLLERGVWEMLGRGGVVLSRLYNSLGLLARSRPYRFVLGYDVERNYQTLLKFLSQQAW